jgi:hypothetical protein
MKARGRKGRFGAIFFIAPAVIISLAVVYAILSSTFNTTGTLIVSAQTSGRYYAPVWLNVTAQVGTRSGVTPLHLSLQQGPYIVQFSQEPWFYPVASRGVQLPAGQTAYVVGVYDPVARTVLIQGGQFNGTQITAFHAITPVIFVNKMSSSVLIQIEQRGNISVPSGGNYTYVFPVSGSFAVTMPGSGSSTLTVSVR